MSQQIRMTCGSYRGCTIQNRSAVYASQSGTIVVFAGNALTKSLMRPAVIVKVDILRQDPGRRRPSPNTMKWHKNMKRVRNDRLVGKRSIEKNVRILPPFLPQFVVVVDQA